MIGELYEHALAGRMRPEVERADGSRMPLAVEGWLHENPGDLSLLDRCQGPTLDIGSGPGRLTVALSERGVPALGIDITPYAVDLARSSGALVMLRDVFGRVPGTGRWMTVLLADGNIGIGGDPAALLRRAGELLAPAGKALVEIEPPGSPLRQEQVRLCHAGVASAWFPWAFVGADHIEDVARDAGLARFTWLAGLAELTAPGCWAYGARGFTSGLANVAPRISVGMLEALQSGDQAGALRLWAECRAFEELRAADSSADNVSVVKEALAQLGLARRDVRPPSRLLPDEIRGEIGKILAGWGLEAEGDQR